jgi:hypothetical protein
VVTCPERRWRRRTRASPSRQCSPDPPQRDWARSSSPRRRSRCAPHAPLGRGTCTLPPAALHVIPGHGPGAAAMPGRVMRTRPWPLPTFPEALLAAQRFVRHCAAVAGDRRRWLWARGPQVLRHRVHLRHAPRRGRPSHRGPGRLRGERHDLQGMYVGPRARE